MAMSNAEAETKAHTPLSFQTDLLLQMLPLEDKVHKKRQPRKYCISKGLSELIHIIKKYRLIVLQHNQSYKMEEIKTIHKSWLQKCMSTRE